MSAGTNERGSSATDGPGNDPTSDVSRYVQDAHGKVPEIGQGRRWYDTPYKLLNWLLTPWRRNALPRRFRAWLNHLANYLLPFHSHDLHKVWSSEDPLHNVVVPADEHVTVSGVWVVELFPPSEFDNLSRSLERNGWDQKRVRIGTGEANQEMLERSRSGQGYAWWRLADIAGEGAHSWFPDGTREALPCPFDAVELVAIQIGFGMTAVLAYFQLTDEAAQSVDAVWHADHEPQLVRGRGLPKAEDRMWTTFRTTQEARRALHGAARSWLALKCPGFFAANSEPQPLLDMLLLEKYDPIPGRRENREFSDALRALGLTDHEILHRTSPDIPKMLLSQMDSQLCFVFRDDCTWTLWGNRKVVAAATDHLDMYGQNESRAIAHVAHKRMRSLLVMLAVSEFLAIVERKYAALRDKARTRHGRFKAAQLGELRSSFLTLSLDLASVARDVDAFWRRKWRDEGDARFNVDRAPWIVSDDKAAGRTRFTPIDMNRSLRKRHRKWFMRLLAADRDYRDILSTVATLGASIDAVRVGRMAIWIAAASLAVALAALLLYGVESDSQIADTAARVRSLFAG